MKISKLFSLFARFDRLSPGDAYEGSLRGDVTIIDVRTPNEWKATGSPKSSRRICQNDKDFEAAVLGLLEAAPDTTLALSCLSGSRAKSAARRLRKVGLTNLKIVEGGISKWVQGGLPVDT
ncbi:molybdopterin biosynthesis protein MoeB [Labrenzia sp. THAF82]|uniref:rhodanese-like domain-containing protein n=1 Tax=Labrenzia sp. THAF82 TaxID=2587861 RepID=UPI0012693A46|nr:rhodanese-like domain-containing protein [Labrenzia sp. THAF82]QFT33262.1 molybdopterin biosynthesis protein MoeB [Labrenzia sp. THAF82]